MTTSNSLCTLCDCKMEPLETINLLKEGCNIIISSSKLREDGQWKKWTNCDEIEVHEKCYLNYTSKSNITAAIKRKRFVDAEDVQLSTFPAEFYTLKTEPSSPVEFYTFKVEPSSPTESSFLAESSTSEVKLSTSQVSLPAAFDYLCCCIFCSKHSKLECKKPKHRRLAIHHFSKDSSVVERILNKCESFTDETTMIVAERLHSLINSSLIGGIYHNVCLNKFISSRTKYEKKERKPKYLKQLEQVFTMLENGIDCQWSLDDIVKSMGAKPPFKRYLKHKLHEKYGDQIIFSSRGAIGAVITLKSHADTILINHFRKSQLMKCNDIEKSKTITSTAENLRKDNVIPETIEANQYTAFDELEQSKTNDGTESLTVN